jgi:hypothetical protein
MIGVTAVGRAQPAKRIEEPLRGGHAAAEILIGAERQKGRICTAVERTGDRGVAAVAGAARLDEAEHSIHDDRIGSAAQGRPAPSQARGMDEVEVSRAGARGQVPRGPIDRRVLLEGDQRVQREDSVIKVADTRAILEAAIRIAARPQERRDEIARFTELPGRQPGDLQHLEPQTHCTSP